MDKTKAKKYLKIVLAVLIAFLLVSIFWSTIFVRIKHQAELSIAGYELSVQFMSADYACSGKYLLFNEGGTYRLLLDTFGTNTSKSYPGAFALVNPADFEVIIRKINVESDLGNALVIYLHKNHTRPCNPSLVAPGILCEDELQLYYDRGTSYDYGTAGWKLGEGFGYNTTGNLMYSSDGISTTNATRINDTWIYDEEGNNLAINGTSNFVWVEVSLIIGKDGNFSLDLTKYEGEISIELEVEFIPVEGPAIDFMAGDRAPEGHYVLTGYAENRVKFNLGRVYPGEAKSYPCAFAIVNTQSIAVRISKIEVIGDTLNALRIYLHKNHTKPCNAAIVAPGIITETSEDMQLYYDGSSSINWGTAGWKLGAGLGYNATGNLIYTDDGTSARAINATRVAGFSDSKCYFWTYVETPTKGSNLANNNTANFVWVELDAIIPSGSADAIISGELVFHFMAA
jgi:hypothetical protein